MKTPLRSLFIHDSEDEALLIIANLEKAGYSIESERAKDSVSLKKALSRHPWDIVFSDYKLAQLSPLEALKIVHGIIPDIPFIIVSGILDEEIVLAAIKAGVSDIVMKDHPQRLASVVYRSLRDAVVQKERSREQNLHAKNQALLNNAFKMARLGYWEYDVRNDLFIFNDQFYSIFKTNVKLVGGYTMPPNDFVQRFVYPEDINKVKLELQIAIATKDPDMVRQFGHRILYSDGSIGLLSIRFSITQDKEGATIYVYGVVQDVTESIHINESLRENEEKYHSIFENSLDALLFTEPGGAILDANPAACKMFKYSKDELKRIGRSGLVDAHDPRLYAALRNRQLNSHATAEITMIRSDGTTFTAEIISSIFLDAKGTQKSSMIIRDITERLKAEEAILQEKIFIDAVFESIPGILYVYDDKGRLIRWNKKHETITGYSAEELSQMTSQDWHPEAEREAVAKAVEAVMETGYGMVESHVLTRDGKNPLMQLNGVRLNLNGKVYFVGIGLDITERKKAEKEIQALNTELEERVLRRTVELTAANKELESFSYSVSHDLRAPLRSIEGFSQILLEEYGDAVPEKGRQYLERMRYNVLHMGELIESILELSRLGRGEIQIVKIDVSSLAAEVAEGLIAENPKRDVRVDIEPGMIAMGDPQLLRIVLVNLLNNAWKFTSKRKHARIKIGTILDPQHGYAYFIHDNGIGFDNAYKEKLFVAFQRLHADRDYPGTGIGLANVQRVIRRHGGEVWAEGRVGKGATFFFTIPAERKGI